MRSLWVCALFYGALGAALPWLAPASWLLPLFLGFLGLLLAAAIWQSVERTDGPVAQQVLLLPLSLLGLLGLWPQRRPTAPEGAGAALLLMGIAFMVCFLGALAVRPG